PREGDYGFPVEEDPRLRAFRPLPANPEVEQAILGAIMVEPSVLDAIPFLSPSHFTNTANAVLFEACHHLARRGISPSPPALKEFLSGDEFNDVGGASYVARVATNAVGAATVPGYAQLVFEMYQRRRLIEIGNEMVDHCYDLDAFKPVAEIWSAAEHEGAGVLPDPTIDEPDTLRRLEQIKNAPGELLGVSTGFKPLDNMLCGLQSGQLAVLAGRPAIGKTSLAAAIAVKSKAPCLFFALDQAKSEIEMKMVSDISDVPLEIMRTGRYTGDQWGRVVDGFNTLRSLPIAFRGHPGMTPQEMRAAARTVMKERTVSMIVIDQLTQIKPPDHRIVQRVHQIGDILKVVKAMARELDVPVLLLHQLSRAVESRDNKRPTLSDLRDSGEIEQDADVVMFIYREEYYLDRDHPEENDDGISDEKELAKRQTARRIWNARKNRAANDAEIIVAKQKMGPTGTVHLYFDGRYSRFGNPGGAMAREQDGFDL
ncbi:MAG: replicative DNA helicase, partial [Pseudomonadota bacterium]